MPGLTKHDVSSRKWTEHIPAHISVFFCGNFNGLPIPKKLWNSLTRSCSTVNCSISQTGLLHSCLCSYIGPISFCILHDDQRSQQYLLTFHLSMFKCDGFYMLDTIRPPYISAYLCNLLCSPRYFEMGVGGVFWMREENGIFVQQ